MSGKEPVEQPRKRVVEKSRPVKMSGGFKICDDAVTVHISMKEATSDFLEKKTQVNKLLSRTRYEAARSTATVALEPEVKSTGDATEDAKMEVKITINMKQLEKHHREIESYISPFTPSPDSIFLRIPPRPEDYAAIENVRDEVDKLVRLVHQMTPSYISEQESREFLRRLRKLDVRLTALYPRQPAPGDKEKKSYRMCPCYEPEMEDIKGIVVQLNHLFRGMKYMQTMNGFFKDELERKRKCTRPPRTKPEETA